MHGLPFLGKLTASLPTSNNYYPQNEKHRFIYGSYKLERKREENGNGQWMGRLLACSLSCSFLLISLQNYSLGNNGLMGRDITSSCGETFRSSLLFDIRSEESYFRSIFAYSRENLIITSPKKVLFSRSAFQFQERKIVF